MVGNKTKNKNEVNTCVSVGEKKTIIDCVCEKHYAKNPSTFSCESGKDCEFGEHLED